MPKLHRECFQGAIVFVYVCVRTRERMYMGGGRSVVKFSGDSDKHWSFF